MHKICRNKTRNLFSRQLTKTKNSAGDFTTLSSARPTNKSLITRQLIRKKLFIFPLKTFLLVFQPKMDTQWFMQCCKESPIITNEEGFLCNICNKFVINCLEYKGYTHNDLSDEERKITLAYGFKCNGCGLYFHNRCALYNDKLYGQPLCLNCRNVASADELLCPINEVEDSLCTVFIRDWLQEKLGDEKDVSNAFVLTLKPYCLFIPTLIHSIIFR